MKKDNCFRSFYYFLVMIIFIIIYDLAFILAARKVEIGTLLVSGSILVYPMTYFIATLFKERFGKEHTKLLFIYSIISLVIMTFLISLTSVLPVAGKTDGLEIIFNVDYKIVLASIIGFFVSQNVNLLIYDFISGYKGFKFLISSVIAITIDSIIFVFITNVGTVSISTLIKLFSSQYICGVLMAIFYAICFAYLVDSVEKCKENALKEEEKAKKKDTTNKIKKESKETKKSTKK